jgi:KipI family sensor histidine kinase inhibitor
MEKNIRIVQASENAFIVYFTEKISPPVFHSIRHFCQAIQAQQSDNLTHLTPSYNNVLINFSKPASNTLKTIDYLHNLADDCLNNSSSLNLDITATTHRLPAYYHPQVGTDIERVLEQCKIASLEQLIALHSEKKYTVYAVGFCPGFAYLAEVDKKIRIPRHPTPRLNVAAGSIGIAEEQTAVYPLPTPGGWHIIGNCPQSLIPNEKSLTHLWQIGDEVIFEPINRKMYDKLSAKI